MTRRKADPTPKSMGSISNRPKCSGMVVLMCSISPISREKNVSFVSRKSVKLSRNSGPRFSPAVAGASESSRCGEPERKRKRCMKKEKPQTAEELDRRFDEGEDIISLGFDVSKQARDPVDGPKKKKTSRSSRPAKPHASKG
jgi:hypothetical protein